MRTIRERLRAARLKQAVLTIGAAAAPLLACATDLASFEPFPCGADQTCPGDYVCVPGTGCTHNALSKAPFPCYATGKCPSPLLCVDGQCTTPPVDTLCDESSSSSSSSASVDCSLSHAVCFKHLCVTACSGSVCPSGRRCVDGHCFGDCTATTKCAEGLSCQDTFESYSLCVAPGVGFAACTSVDATSCSGTSTSWLCPDSSVWCSSAGGCPAGTQCDNRTGGCTDCPAGSVRATCDGTPCTGPSCSSGWGCKPVEAAKPGCDGALTKWQGTCECKQGRSVSFTCSSTDTCEARCKKALSTGK